jgi:Uma2 family endonuclease
MAPIDVRLTPFDIVQPDLIVLSAGVERLRGDQQTVENAPNVVIEIISRGSGRTDRVRKMALYARSGVPEYWIVDPFERAITVNVLEGQRYVVADSDASGRTDSQSLPGMTLDPAEVFSGVD